MKKFTKFMKNKNSGHNKRYKSENQNFVSNYKSYGCGERYHVKVYYPKKCEENKGKRFLKMKAYIA